MKGAGRSDALARLRSHVRGSAASRLGWGVADQAVSSITNLVLGIVLARSLTLAEFGAFSLAWVTYGVILNISRGIATDPLAVRYSGEADDRWSTATRRAASTATALGLASLPVCLLLGFTLGGSLGAAFAGLGLTLPLLLLQDSWRIAFFTAGRGRSAFVNDLVWGLAMVPAMVIANTVGGTFAFMVAWGLAAGVAAAWGCVQTRLFVSHRGIVSWVREHRDLGPRYLVENVSDAASAQAHMSGLGAISGLTAVAGVRGSQLLVAPIVALRMGISLMAVPEAARVLQRWPHRLQAFCLVLGGSQALACLLWGGCLLLVPEALGVQVLAGVWQPAAALIVPMSVMMAAGSLFDGAVVGLRALGASTRSLPVRLFRAVAWTSLGVYGAVLDGPWGSVWGTALGNCLATAVAYWQLRLAARELIPEPIREADG